jgi:hypothetical protein
MSKSPNTPLPPNNFGGCDRRHKRLWRRFAHQYIYSRHDETPCTEMPQTAERIASLAAEQDLALPLKTAELLRAVTNLLD